MRLGLIVRRILQGILTMWVLSLLVFFGVEALPGDVADAVLGQFATEETLQVIRDRLRLERPVHVRYLEWARGLLTGDLGRGLASERPIGEILALPVPMTFLLGAITAMIAVPIALVLGIVAASAQGSLLDRAISFGTLLVLSGPEFLTATALVMLFAVELRWFPSIAYLPVDAPVTALASALALPVATLTLAVLAPMTRMTRGAMINVLATPAIEMAILKGMPRWRILCWHALPNAAAPIANAIASNLAFLMTGVVIVEVVFSYPGLGKLLVDAVEWRDIPLVQTCAMLFCAIYAGLYLVADVIAILVNPRLRAAA